MVELRCKGPSPHSWALSNGAVERLQQALATMVPSKTIAPSEDVCLQQTITSLAVSPSATVTPTPGSA